MFDQMIDRPYRRRGLSKKGWAKMLLFYAALSVTTIFLFLHLSNKDAQIAKREVVVAGTIVKIHKGKSDTADYTFQFEGNWLSGSDDCDYLGLTVGREAKVFVDPQNPKENGLRSFGFKNALNRDDMKLAVYLSVGLAPASAILWMNINNDRAPGNRNVA